MIGMNISDYIRWKQHNSLTRPPTSTQTSAEPAATAAAAAAAVPAGLLPIPRSARSGANKTTRSKGFFTQLAGEGGQKVPRDCRVEEEPRKCEGQTKSAAVGPPPTVQQKQKQKQKQKKTSVATQAEDGKEREVARLKAKLDQRSVGLLMMQQQLHALEAQAKQREQELAAKDTQLAAASDLAKASEPLLARLMPLAERASAVGEEACCAWENAGQDGDIGPMITALEKSIDVLAAVAALKGLWQKEPNTDPLIPTSTPSNLLMQQQHVADTDQETSVQKLKQKPEQRQEQTDEASQQELAKKALLRLQQLREKQQQQQQQQRQRQQSQQSGGHFVSAIAAPDSFVSIHSVGTAGDVSIGAMAAAAAAAAAAAVAAVPTMREVRVGEPKSDCVRSCLESIQLALGGTSRSSSSSSSSSLDGNPQLLMRLQMQEQSRVHELVSALEAHTLAISAQEHSQISNRSRSCSATGVRSGNDNVQNVVPVFAAETLQRDHKQDMSVSSPPRPRHCSGNARKGPTSAVKASRQGAGPKEKAGNRTLNA